MKRAKRASQPRVARVPRATLGSKLEAPLWGVRKAAVSVTDPVVAWVTHELLIGGQIVGACAYTGASYRLWRARFDRLALGLLSTGVALDIVLAVLGSTSDLGDNPDGMPWRHPLFAVAVVLATLGMLGYMVNLVLMAVRPWRLRAGGFLRYSQLVIWPSWMVGVALFILNVYAGWF